MFINVFGLAFPNFVTIFGAKKIVSCVSRSISQVWSHALLRINSEAIIEWFTSAKICGLKIFTALPQSEMDSLNTLKDIAAEFEDFIDMHYFRHRVLQQSRAAKHERTGKSVFQRHRWYRISAIIVICHLTRWRLADKWRVISVILDHWNSMNQATKIILDRYEAIIENIGG